jgi:hypothetical protein
VIPPLPVAQAAVVVVAVEEALVLSALELSDFAHAPNASVVMIAASGKTTTRRRVATVVPFVQ